MTADYFGLHGRKPTESEIDRGAQALRRLEQGGRVIRQWSDLPLNVKRKWRDKARVVLKAALSPVGTS